MSYDTEPENGDQMKALLLFSAAALSSGAAALGGQATTAKPDSACTTYPGGRVECHVYRSGKGDSTLRRRLFFGADSAMAKRAALGIEVRSTGTIRDTLGVFVDAVTPKGPAESAGIVEGDRIAAINGVDLRTTTADTEDSYTNGLAAHRLSREVQKLTPGARVTLRVYSGGRVRDVQVTAGKASEVMRLGGRFNMPGMAGMMRFEGPGGGAMMFAPEMPMLRERLPDMPMLRERLRDLPRKIQLRVPMPYKTLAPLREQGPEVYKLDESDWSDFDEPFAFELDDEPFTFQLDEEPFDFESEIVPVSADAIRELAATAARDARVGLEQLAAARIA
jgi:PDZ domain